MKSKCAATVTIHRPLQMTAQGKRLVANWLRRQASLLERKGNELSKKYTAQYLYDDEE